MQWMEAGFVIYGMLTKSVFVFCGLAFIISALAKNGLLFRISAIFFVGELCGMGLKGFFPDLSHTDRQTVIFVGNVIFAVLVLIKPCKTMQS